MTPQTDVPDYSEYQDENPIGDNLMKTVTDLADKMTAAESEMEKYQALLDEAKENHRRITEKEIPEALDGLEGDIKLPDGRVIQIAEKIRTHLSADSKPAALDWLDNNGHSALVKRRFIIEFGKGEDKWADKFANDLAKRKKPLNVKRERNVHPQTLTAFVKQSLEDGEDLPLKLFGVFRQRFAKMK